MTFQFPAKFTVDQFASRGHRMMDEGAATVKLASALIEFEVSVGRSVVVSVVRPGAGAVILGDDVADTAEARE